MPSPVPWIPRTHASRCHIKTVWRPSNGCIKQALLRAGKISRRGHPERLIPVRGPRGPRSDAATLDQHREDLF
jgi:hypothetical protein